MEPIVKKVNGRFALEFNNKIVEALYDCASKDITIIPKFGYLDIVIRACGKITKITREDAEEDFLKTFSVNELSGILWDMAWAIYKVGEIDDPTIKDFFDKHYKEIAEFKNHGMVEYIVNSYLMNSKAGAVLDKMDKTASVCKSDTEKYLQDIEGRRAELLKRQEAMISNLRECIRQITAESLTALETMQGQYLAAAQEMAMLKSELFEAKDELRRVKSEEHEREVGEEFLRRLIDEYIKPYEDSDDKEERKRIYKELWNFVSRVKGVPEDVKERVRQLDLPLKKKLASTSVGGNNNGIVAGGDVNVGLSNEGEEKLVKGLLNRKLEGNGNSD